MARRVLLLTLPSLIGLTSLGLATEQRKAPKRPEEVFLVYVYTEGLVNEDVDMPRAANEVSKRISKKKKWLKVVDSRERASIVVEVLTHIVDEQSRTLLDYRVDDQGIGKHLYEDTFVSTRHRIEARVTFPDGTQKIFTGEDKRDRGGSIKGAASSLANQLEDSGRQLAALVDVARTLNSTLEAPTLLGRVNAVALDGHAGFISDDIDNYTFAYLICSNDRQPSDMNEYLR